MMLPTLDLGSLAAAAATVFVFLALRRFVDFRARAKAIGPDLPGFRLTGWPLPLPAPWKRLRGVSASGRWLWERKYETFAGFGLDICSTVSALPRVWAGILVADPAVVKEVTSARNRFPKAVQFYRLLAVFGPNIIASEFDEHKKFRKAVAPCFSERNNRLVWDETIKIVLGLFETEEWRGKSTVELDHCVKITIPIALFVIGVAGFGRQVSWDADTAIPKGHVMPFKEALNVASLNLRVPMLLPRWATQLRASWAHAALAFDDLNVYMKEMIRQRRDAVVREERFDLFSGLLEAADDSKDQLTDEELIGNVFVFLIAGHETTAHTLAFTFGLLALYQDEQEKLYQHITSVVAADGTMPAYEEMGRLTYSLAVFYETLRLYPPVTNIAKYAAEDSVFTTTATHPDGTYSPKQVVVPKNTFIGISITGMHYNPRYWDNPNEFRPSRFLSEYPRDAFMPFSAGARACIGRKFFETEGLAILTTLIHRYKITLKDNPEWKGLTVEQKREQLLRAKPVLTLT
ncbi:cytochrome P450 [Exidia glandulosa HHB12029]|uniref:Cytochrome P450 n=1 Tax=Exidia glandulosa HHB12029 TaxID=1314781 RepID=A0A165LDZ6_EXIGL|nr:cytochrome P450 [Exidia glandulosa HHB12029]